MRSVCLALVGAAGIPDRAAPVVDLSDGIEALDRMAMAAPAIPDEAVQSRNGDDAGVDRPVRPYLPSRASSQAVSHPLANVQRDSIGTRAMIAG